MHIGTRDPGDARSQPASLARAPRASPRRPRRAPCAGSPSRSLTPLPSEPWRLTAGLALPDMSCSLYRVFSLPDPETIPQNGMVLYCTFPKQSPPTPVSYMLRRSLGRVPRIRPDPGTRSPGMVGAQDTVAVLVNTVAWFGSHTVAALVKAPLRYGNPCWCRAVRGAGAAPARA